MARARRTSRQTRKKASLLLLIELIGGAAASILSLLAFFVITDKVLALEVMTLDLAFSQFVYQLRNDFLTQVVYVISLLGGEFIVLASAVVVLFLAIKKHTKEALFFSLIMLASFSLNYAIKILLQVPRPDVSPLATLTTYSFPSGHTMNSLVFYVMLSYFVFKLTRSYRARVISVLLVLVLVPLIGFSRVYLGVHYPSDVLAGFIVGFWWCITVMVIDSARTFYKIYK